VAEKIRSISFRDVIDTSSLSLFEELSEMASIAKQTSSSIKQCTLIMNSAPSPPPPPRHGGGGEHGNESLWKLDVRLFWDLMNRLLASISRHLMNEDAIAPTPQDTPPHPRWIDICEAQPKRTPFEKLCANLLRNDAVTKDIAMMLYYPLPRTKPR
jgi:hypothetical protein